MFQEKCLTSSFLTLLKRQVYKDSVEKSTKIFEFFNPMDRVDYQLY